LQKNNIKYMWKDFFNFSKRERVTIIALTFLIILVQLMIWTKDSWVRFLPENVEQKYRQKKELEAYRDSVTAQKPMYATKGRTYKEKQPSVPVKLIPFNPNTADSLKLCGLGLRSYVVKNILNYRRKGGQFRKSADFARIYGLDPEAFAKLEPFIQIDGQNGSDGATALGAGAVISTAGVINTKKSEDNSFPQTNKVGQATTENKIVAGKKSTEQAAVKSSESQGSGSPNFDLNSADTSMLLQLKGVGSYTANRIASYRNQLGGFYSMTQLSEVKGLYPETLARLQSMLKINPDRINTLNVNKASLEKLKAHPYLSFYQAKVIVELRKARGKISSIDELKTFKEFTPVDLERLKWYLDFR